MGVINFSDWTSWFDLGADSGLVLIFSGTTAVFVGVASLMLKQGTYAIFAVLIAALGVIIGPVRHFVLAIPNFIVSSIPAASGYTGPILVLMNGIITFVAYWFIFAMVLQRDT
jgi:hypothetical protein